MRESASLDFWPSVAKTLSYTSKYCRCYRMIQPRNTQHTTNSRSCCLGGVWRQRRQAQDGDGGNCCGRNHVAGPVQPCHACVAQHWWEVEPQPREGGGGDGGRDLCHASSLLDLTECRHSLSPLVARLLLLLRLADNGDGNALGWARCYALVLNGHCRLRLKGLEIRAKGVLCWMISNAAIMRGGQWQRWQ